MPRKPYLDIFTIILSSCKTLALQLSYQPNSEICNRFDMHTHSGQLVRGGGFLGFWVSQGKSRMDIVDTSLTLSLVTYDLIWNIIVALFYIRYRESVWRTYFSYAKMVANDHWITLDCQIKDENVALALVTTSVGCRYIKCNSLPPVSFMRVYFRYLYAYSIIFVHCCHLCLYWW